MENRVSTVQCNCTIVSVDPANVAMKLNEFRKTGVLCDIILIVGGKQFPCHRCVLSATVPYFERMFNLNFSEQKQREVTLNNIDENAFGILLDFLYTGKLKMHSHNVKSLIIMTSVTDYLGLEDLSNKCINILKRNTNINNLFEICSCVVDYRNDYIIEFLNNFVINNFSEVLSSEQFCELPYFILKNVVYNDYVTTEREEEIFNAVDKWIGYDSERMKYLNELVQGIRFTFIDDTFLTNQLDNTSVVATALKSLKEKNDFKVGFYKRIHKYLYFFGPKLKVEDIEKEHYIHVMRHNGRHFKQVPKMTIAFFNRVSQQVTVSDGNIYNFSYISETNKNIFQYFDNVNECWIKLEVPCYAVKGYNMVSLNSTNCIYLNSSAHRNQSSSDCKIYCYVKDRNEWLSIQDRVEPHHKVSCTSMVTCNNMLYICGGLGSYYAGTELSMFDPRIGKWCTLAPMPKKRAYPAAGCVNGKIYVTGGTNHLVDDNNVHIYKSTMVYDIKGDKWTSCKAMANAMYSHSLIPFEDALWAVGAEVPINIYSFRTNEWSNGPVISDYFKNEVKVTAN